MAREHNAEIAPRWVAGHVGAHVVLEILVESRHERSAGGDAVAIKAPFSLHSLALLHRRISTSHS